MDICLWDQCNNNCLMCTNPDKPWSSQNGFSDEGYDYRTLIKRFKSWKEKIAASDTILLTGGEPTLHPRFLDILKFLRQQFPDQEIRILTNGRRFFYLDFAKKVLQTKNLNLAVSLYGPNSKIHDAITRTKGSFNQTIKGIENLLICKNNNQFIEIRTVISKLSYQYLNQILNLIKSRFSTIDRLVLIFMEVEGQADKNFKRVGVSYSQARPYLEKIYPALADFKKTQLYHFPLCTLPKKFWPYLWRTLPLKETAFIPSCHRCKYQKYCLGIHKGYLRAYGSKEFKPIKDNFIIEGEKDFYHPITKIKRR